MPWKQQRVGSAKPAARQYEDELRQFIVEDTEFDENDEYNHKSVE